jgi:hypothetical protein
MLTHALRRLPMPAVRFFFSSSSSSSGGGSISGSGATTLLHLPGAPEQYNLDAMYPEGIFAYGSSSVALCFPYGTILQAVEEMSEAGNHRKPTSQAPLLPPPPQQQPAYRAGFAFVPGCMRDLPGSANEQGWTELPPATGQASAPPTPPR